MSDTPGTAVAALAFRLGLSWLVGRRLLLLTTSGPDERVHRTVLGYRWRNGVVCVDAAPGARWMVDLAARPVAMIQAAPGPLTVAAVIGEDGTVSFPATGRPGPAPVVPDLLWVYPVAVAGAVLLAVVRRRARAGRRRRGRG